MKIKDVSFPYPVLGIGDDIDSTTSMNANIKQEKDDYIVDFSLIMSNNAINALIATDFAQYVCEIDCSSTYYRTHIESSDPTFHIKIPRRSVSGRISFQCTVTVKKEISNYTNEKFNDDYKDYSFHLYTGDILAFIGDAHYDADIEYDKLRSAGSMMTVVEGPDNDNALYYLGHDKIEIQLPHSLFIDYKNSFSQRINCANIFNSSLVLNALIFALLKYNNEDYGEKLWARTLCYRIETESDLQKYQGTLDSKDQNEILRLAQVLLCNPYEKLFTTVHTLTDNLTYEEEE